jgi:hypothetical protein
MMPRYFMTQVHQHAVSNLGGKPCIRGIAGVPGR